MRNELYLATALIFLTVAARLPAFISRILIGLQRLRRAKISPSVFHGVAGIIVIWLSLWGVTATSSRSNFNSGFCDAIYWLAYFLGVKYLMNVWKLFISCWKIKQNYKRWKNLGKT